MQMILKMKKLCNMTTFAIAASAAFLVSLVPIVMAGLVNRASGDDLGYSWRTHIIYQNTQSLKELLTAAATTVYQTYHAWDSRWSTNFFLALQPEVFNDRAYTAVTIVTIFFWILITSLVLYSILVRMLGFPFNSFILINSLFLLVNIHFVDSYRAALFWYTGVIAYQLPYFLCMILIILVIYYAKHFRIREFIGICLIAIFIGGSAYQAALFSLLVLIFCTIFYYFLRHNKKAISLLVPISLALTGLIISMRAPGNKVRGGSDFGFSFERAGGSIIASFQWAMRDIGAYFQEKPLAIVLLFIMLTVVFSCRVKCKEKNNFCYPLPCLFFLFTFLLFVAMQAPQVYAGVSIYARAEVAAAARGVISVIINDGAGTSGGVANFNFYIFTLMILANGIYLSGWLFAKFGDFIRKHVRILQKAAIIGYVSSFIVVILLALSPKYELGLSHTTFWVSYDYLRTGRAEEYRWQMDLQTAILRDDTIKDAVVPFINYWQGPLMHMNITDDPASFTNSVTRLFYGKTSVIAIDRLEWNELYGHLWPDYRKE
ncbi:MAG: DUF6056 family protein [Lachnospiraceae bacterium]|nr:DUF6056 family protein [Lachnospiraceae bacterium]